MIARIWKVETSIDSQEDYTNYLRKKIIPKCEKTDGFMELTFMKREQSKSVEFTLITFWESMEAINTFTNGEPTKIKLYPTDKDYILSFDETVTHHEVFAL